MPRLLFILALFLLCINTCSKKQVIYDLCISGGTIIDGTGNQAFTGNVYIQGDKIVLISKGEEPVMPSKELIDAKGLYVAPGFIDAHTHSDYTLLVDGLGQSKIRQGVTTEILGESESGGPVFGPAITSKERDLKQLELKCTWKTFGEYFDRVRQSEIAVNIASLVGLGQVRMCVIGEINRPPTPEEMQKMKELITEAMKEGAIGIAAGLIYVPDMYITTEELIDLASVAAEHSGIFSVHIRSEAEKLLESLDELITISKKAHIPVHVMHFKASEKANWHLMDPAIKKIEESQKEGINITADQYPYTASMTTLTIILPDWAREGGIEGIMARLKNPQERLKIKNYIHNEKYGFDSYQEYFKNIMIASVLSEKNKSFEGRILWDIIKEQKKEPADFVLNFMTEEEAQISAIYFTMSEENKEKEFRQPWVCVGSDGAATSNRREFLAKDIPILDFMERFHGLSTST